MMQIMLTRTIMTVLIILTGASCADAGLIDSRSFAIGEPSASAIENLLSGLMPLVDDEPANDGVVNDGTKDLAGMSSSSTVPCNVFSCIDKATCFHKATGIAWYLSLDNAILPVSPVLNGLLKPS